MNELLINECQRLINQRANYYETCLRTEDYHGVSRDVVVSAAIAYQSARAMLDYAIGGHADCLAQFAYFREDT